MAKSKVVIDKPAPTGVLALIGHGIGLLIHKLPPGSIMSVVALGLITFLYILGVNHGTESSKHSREAWEKLAAVIDEGQKAQLAEQKAWNAKQDAHNEKVRENQAEMIRSMKGKP